MYSGIRQCSCSRMLRQKQDVTIGRGRNPNPSSNLQSRTTRGQHSLGPFLLGNHPLHLADISVMNFNSVRDVVRSMGEHIIPSFYLWFCRLPATVESNTATNESAAGNYRLMIGFQNGQT